MINKLYKNIAAGLRTIKPCTIYQEDVPQDFKQPSFLISFYDQNPVRGINGRLKNTVGVDVSYFPEDESNSNDECWGIGEKLSLEFGILDFKIRNRNLKIVDKVLHFMFDVDYREYKPDGSPRMQTVSQNTNVKEK
ncbi:MAG: hypothetical protein RSD63_10300 [Eubacterium sp.]